MNGTSEVFNPIKFFEGMKDSPHMNNVRAWIESYSPLEDVIGLSFDVEPFELLFDKDGKQPESLRLGWITHIASPITEVTAVLKDGSAHAAGYLQTGELFKRQERTQFGDAVTHALVVE